MTKTAKEFIKNDIKSRFPDHEEPIFNTLYNGEGWLSKMEQYALSQTETLNKTISDLTLLVGELRGENRVLQGRNDRQSKTIEMLKETFYRVSETLGKDKDE